MTDWNDDVLTCLCHKCYHTKLWTRCRVLSSYTLYTAVHCWSLQLCIRPQIVQDVHNLSTGARTIHSHECSPAVGHSHKSRGGVSNPPLCLADVMLLWHHSQKPRWANSREIGHGWVTNGLCLKANHSAPCAATSIAPHHLAAILQIKFSQTSFECGGNKDKHR